MVKRFSLLTLTVVTLTAVLALSAAAASAAVLSQTPRTMDDALARVGEVFPGFGGFYYDAQGRAHVVVTTADAAQRFLDLDEGVIVERGEFEFRQLQNWRLRLRPVTLGLPGVVSLDVDEVANRVRIGVEPGTSEADLAKIRASLAFQLIPDQAVIVSQQEPFHPVATLQDAVRPISGGLQINFGNFLCTLSYNASRNGVPGFVTCSHCTDRQGGVDDTEYFQSLFNNSSVVAVEIADPDYVRRANGCPHGKKCRFSDTSFAAYAAPSLSAGNKIARTTSRGQFSGSLTIDNSNPTFNVSGFADGDMLAVGTEINKVGRTSGWTFGPVTQSCVDVLVSGSPILLFCQTLTATASLGGDSGSPVFLWDGGNNATIVGNLWGGNNAGDVMVFSPYSAAKAELGLD